MQKSKPQLDKVRDQFYSVCLFLRRMFLTIFSTTASDVCDFFCHLYLLIDKINQKSFVIQILKSARQVLTLDTVQKGGSVVDVCQSRGYLNEGMEGGVPFGGCL